MFERILVPTDGSERAKVAVEVGRRLAEREHGTLTLLRVESERAGIDEALADTAALEQLAAETREKGARAASIVEFGRPAESIALTAAEQDCTLIVLAHQHRGMLGNLRHPSVTARLFARTLAPLLLWPERMPADAVNMLLDEPNAEIIVPVDGSPEAENVLDLAVALAKKTGRPIFLVRVLVQNALATTSNPYYVDPEVAMDEERQAREYLSALRRNLTTETGLTVQSTLLSGNAPEQIARLASAHEGALVVMSTHGRSGIGRFFFGSVAAGVMERAETPVLVVPPVRYARAEQPAEAKAKHEEEEPVAVAGFGPLF